MKFFGRESECAILMEIAKRSQESAQFTVLSGARRVGKTSLVKNVFGNDNMLYFFVSKKTESALCDIFQKEVEQKLGVPMPEKAMSFEQLFDYLMRLSESRSITLFIDEFQEFKKVDESIYGDIQKIWDLRKDNSHINLIVGGSAKSMLLKLFEDKSEPLFGRQTAAIKLEHFYPALLQEILSTYNPNYTADDLLALYSITGGVARYVELLMDAHATTRTKMIQEIVKPSSIFLSEGKNHIIEEFGKDYGTYFSILTAIATGHFERAQIEDIVGKGVGGYLATLEDTYGIIKKHQPLFVDSNKTVKYILNDSFYVFWFRYIYRYNYMIEIGAFDQLMQVIQQDFDTFTGKRLESLYREMLIERNQYTRIDTWWSRTGQSEIDLIAINELNKTAEFYEVKRQSDAFDKDLLHQRVQEFLTATRKLKGYSISEHSVSLENL